MYRISSFYLRAMYDKFSICKYNYDSDVNEDMKLQNDP